MRISREKKRSSSSACFDIGVVGMALDVGIEQRRGELAAELVALQLGHVDAVGGKAAHRLVERGRHVADAEDEGRHHRSRRRCGALDPLLGLGQHDEAGDVVVGVLDILLDDVEAVERRRPARGASAAMVRSPLLGDQLGRARRVAGDHRLPAVLADVFAALAERVDVAVDGLDLLDRSTPGSTISWKWIGRKYSPMMCSRDSGSR